MNQFGLLYNSWDFEAEVAAFLDRWIDSYLSETERRLDLTPRYYARPKSLNVAFDDEKFPENQLPAILVVVDGFEDPTRIGGDIYSGWLTWSLVIWVKGQTEKDAHKFAQTYGAAIRSLVLKRPSLDGTVNTTEWEGESYGSFITSGERNRTIAGVAIDFRSLIDAVVDGNGPLEPDASDPLPVYPDWPEIVSKDFTLDSVPLEEDLQDDPEG